MGRALGRLPHAAVLRQLPPRHRVSATAGSARLRAPARPLLTFSMELMVTPAAQETTMWRSSMSGPTSSKMKGMMGGFTARKRTSLLFTVSLLLTVKFTPIFCSGWGQTGPLSPGAARGGRAAARPRRPPSVTHPQPAHGGQVGVRGARRDLVRGQDPCERHRASARPARRRPPPPAPAPRAHLPP